MFETTDTRLLLPYKQVLGTISLPADKRQILEERYLRLLETSYRRCRRIALVYNINRVCITIGSIVVPALLSIQHTGSEVTGLGIFWTTWIISLCVTISNGFMTMFKFDRKYYVYHASFEQLKTEGWQFLSLTGHYKSSVAGKMTTHEEQFQVFAQTVERIRMRQTEEEYVRLQDTHQGAQASSAKVWPVGPAANTIPTVFEYAQTPAAQDDVLKQILELLHGRKGRRKSMIETGGDAKGNELIVQVQETYNTPPAQPQPPPQPRPETGPAVS